MGGGAQLFQLLAGEDVDGNEMNLGVAVLASLGGGHVNNLARAVLDHNESVLAKSGTLHGIGSRCTSIGAVEGMLMLCVLTWLASVHTNSSINALKITDRGSEEGGEHKEGGMENPSLPAHRPP